MCRGNERAVFEVGPVHPLVHLPERGQVEQPGYPQHVVAVHVQFPDERLQHQIGHRRGNLQPHRRPEPAPRQFPFQRLQQVLVAVLLDLQVGVAGHPEQVMLDDLHPGEQRAQVCRDEFLQRQEAVRPAAGLDGHQARHVVGYLDPGEQLLPAVRVAHHHGEVQ